MIQSLLIANRGEIACRIIRTAREMGIRTIAVYSDADAKALHVRMADEAVHIGPSEAAKSYLVGDKIIKAAQDSGAQAIHPGYGFLSENADFAQSVMDANIIWVGPKPHSIRAMGLKDAAKTLMSDAGVPVTPGYIGDNQKPDYLSKQADEIGYPVLIKAIAGGGGKGMRKVDTPADFADSLTSCQREASTSFGNDIVLIEKWIESPRHIEVQIFGDSHGNIVHLFERDCSLQRRHQKVIEEAPAPGMDEATREAVCGAAVLAAKAVDYEGAGTVEFIADGSNGLDANKIWFMEMNTRLQVEHPVTEEITDVDLVEWQLRVASGEEIPKHQEELSIHGHAIEARLYAEDPANGFLPSTGVLERCCFQETGVRIETGVEEDHTISPYYDPMIAKIINWDSHRKDAIQGLAASLSGTAMWPVKSNAAYLYKLITHHAFQDAALSTAFIEDYAEDLKLLDAPSEAMLKSAARELVYQYNGAGEDKHDGFRLNAIRNNNIRMKVGEQRFIALAPPDFYGPVFSSKADDDIALITDYGQTFAIALDRYEGGMAASASDGAILSPMPGKIIAVEISEGDKVTKGQKLLTLEAMKMEHSLIAPFDGIVTSLLAKTNAQVQVDALLAQIDTEA